ncbi:hypothetical protein ACIBVL_33765 [Streptomyces sp. NPDC049687]|uniref:hypothetical protein n=1 Tax=Streptomyces sp. NPDC049687 TaxID=3365596 RepID=UPI0037B2F834
MHVRVLVDVVVIASVVPSLAIAPRVLARRPDPVAEADRRVFAPAVWLALVTCLIYVNQVLFTVYVLRVYGGDPSFIARYLPTGWFDLASAHPFLRGLAERIPAPGLLAPSVLRIQAFLELPFVLLAFATVVRWLDADLYRRVARSALLPLASLSFTAVFCLVEWDLRNPYTPDDLVIRAVAAVITPLLMARAAARDTGTTRVTTSLAGLLVFIGSLGALGGLVLIVYDTALLYNLGRIDDRLPLALTAAGLLLCLRGAASRPRARSTSTPTLSFVVHALRHWLVLFFVPALAVRYGLLFGTPSLALTTGGLTAAVACVQAGRDTLTETRDAPGGTARPMSALLLTGGIGCAILAGAGGAAVAVRLTPRSYEEVALLSALAGFLVTGVAVCGLIDIRLAAVLKRVDEDGRLVHHSRPTP